MKTVNRMNRYQLIKENQDMTFQFIKNGILSYQIIRDTEIFESYTEMDNITKELKYILLGEQYELSSERIRQIITQMERTIT